MIGNGNETKTSWLEIVGRVRSHVQFISSGRWKDAKRAILLSKPRKVQIIAGRCTPSTDMLDRKEGIGVNLMFDAAAFAVVTSFSRNL